MWFAPQEINLLVCVDSCPVKDILLNLQGFFGFSFLTICIYFYLYLLLIFDCCIAGTNSPLCCSLWELTSPKKVAFRVSVHLRQSINRIDYIYSIPVFSYSKILFRFTILFSILQAFYVVHVPSHRRESTTRMAMATFWHTFHHNGKVSPAWWRSGCTPTDERVQIDWQCMATFRIHSIMMVNSTQPGEGGGCTPSPFHSIYYRAKLRGQKHSSYFSSTLFSYVYRAFID
jgi:hypothetical protein